MKEPDIFIKSARTALKEGETERQLRHHAKAANSYWSGIKALLAVAVCEYNSMDAGLSYLQNERVTYYINQCAEETRMTMAQICAKHEYETVIGGNYHLLVLTNIAWLIDCDDSAVCFVSVSNERSIQRYGTKFWNDYASGMSCLIDRRRYHPATLKLKGREKHWDTYRELMRAVTHEEDLRNPLD